jgi:hypothetical protein
MDWEIVAPLIFSIILTLTIGGVILLKPLTSRLVELIEVMTREKGEGRLGRDVEHVRDLVETMNSRLALLEERQDFTDKLLTSRTEDLPRPPASDG